MSAFADVLDLRTAVVEQMRRSDFVDVFPRLVSLAEVQFNRRLRCREQMASEPVMVTNGVAPLPSCGVLEIIGVHNRAGQEYIEQPPQVMKGQHRAGGYAIVGNDLIAGVDEELVMDYYAAIPSLSGPTATTNWLLRKHPSLYLYGVTAEAAKYLRDAEILQAMAPILAMEYRDIAALDETQRYSRARVRVRGVTP